MIEKRSGCPVNLALEVLGDRWRLIVIRDIMFGNRRHFRGVLTRSQKGIASNGGDDLPLLKPMCRVLLEGFDDGSPASGPLPRPRGCA